MKSIIRIVLYALLFFGLYAARPTWGQQHQEEETVSVPKNMLTKTQLEEVAAKDLKARMERYGNWVGVGHEVGVAVNEGLSAINAQSNAFANTKAGKWTIFIIVFKVLGEPVIGLLFSFILILIGLPLWLWSYKKYLPRQVVATETLDSASKVTTRTYKTYEPEEADGWKIAHCLFLLFLFAAAAVAVFSRI